MTDGRSNVGLVTKMSSGVELTVYVQPSPTCQVGVPIDDACGAFGRDGEPNFARFAGPKATAAIAMPTSATVIAAKPRGLIRMPFLVLRSREYGWSIRELLDGCRTPREPANMIRTDNDAAKTIKISHSGCLLGAWPYCSQNGRNT